MDKMWLLTNYFIFTLIFGVQLLLGEEKVYQEKGIPLSFLKV